MALSFINKQNGTNLVRVDGGLYDKQIVSLYEKEDDLPENKWFEELNLKKNGKFQVIPSNHERNVIFITGASGSGKSHWIKQFLIEYKKKFSKRHIYVFSMKKKDPTIDEVKYLFDRVVCDDTLISNPLKIEDFKESCVVLDDVENFPKRIKEALYQLRDEILELGRQDKITCIIANHLPTGLEIKKVLNECQIIVFFLANWTRGLQYLLKEYLGLDKHEINRIDSKRSRASVYVKTFPNCIITDSDIWIRKRINDDDDTTIRVVEDNSSKKTGKGNDDIYESSKICDTCLYSYTNFDTHKKTLHHLNALDLKHQPK